jgi:hypothetical protein
LPEANLRFHSHARTPRPGLANCAVFIAIVLHMSSRVTSVAAIEPALHRGPEVRALPGDERRVHGGWAPSVQAWPTRGDGDLRRLGRASWRSSRPVELISPVSCRKNGHLAPGNGRSDVWPRSAHLSSPTQPECAREPFLTGKELDSER